MKGFNLHWARMKVISILLVIALVLSPLNTLRVFGSEITNAENNEVLDSITTPEIPTGPAIGVTTDSSNDVVVVTGSAITLVETTDHELYYEDTAELIEMILQAEENGTIDQTPELYSFGTEEVKEMFVEKYDALYYVDHREFPDGSSVYLFIDSLFDEKTGEREKLDLVFVMVNLTNNDQRFTVGVEGLEKVSMTTTAYSIVVPEEKKPTTPVAEEETVETPLEEETTEISTEEDTTKAPSEEETAETTPSEEETTEVSTEEETIETIPSEEETTEVSPEEETTETYIEEMKTELESEDSQLSISRNSLGTIKLFSSIEEPETTPTEEETTEASGEVEIETKTEMETEIESETEIETETESEPESETNELEEDNLDGPASPIDSEEMKWELGRTTRTSSDTLTADSNTAMVQSLSGLSLFAMNLADKYLGASFYDYSITGTNTNINSVISGLSGNNNNKLFIGTGINNSAQNSYDSRDIVTLGIAKDNLNSSGNVEFNYTTVDLFPNKGVSPVRGLTASYDFGFPLKNVGNGYYEFNSFENHLYVGNYSEVDGVKNLTLLDGPDNISGYGTFFPLNNRSNESPNYYFGTKLTTSFLMPKDGMLGNDPMIFEFSGDDDVWVYINGKLALDLGGIHGIVKGYIDFATGLVTIDRVARGSNSTQIAYWYLYDDYTTDTQATNAMRTKTGNNNITISKRVGLEKVDFATYDFTMYYMERGANISNFYLRLNFPMIDTDKVSVVKDVQNMPVGTNDTYEFELWIEGENTAAETITVAAGSVGTFDTDIPLNERYFVKEVSTGNYTTSWTTQIENTTATDIRVGIQTDVFDIDEINIVKFINVYSPSGTLTIGKIVEGDSSDTISAFAFRVTLKDKDNNPLISVKVGGSNVTLVNGIYETSLGNGEEITISELPIGTNYIVEELLTSDNPYYEISLEGIVREVETIGGTPAIVTDNPTNPASGTVGVQNDDNTTITQGSWSYTETSKIGTVGPIEIEIYGGNNGDVVWYRSDGTLATESDFVSQGGVPMYHIEEYRYLYIFTRYRTNLPGYNNNNWERYNGNNSILNAIDDTYNITDLDNSDWVSGFKYFFLYNNKLYQKYTSIENSSNGLLKILENAGYTNVNFSKTKNSNSVKSGNGITYDIRKTDQELYNEGFKKRVYTYTEEEIVIPSTTVLLQNVEITYTNSVNIILGSITIDKSLVVADGTDTNSFIFKLRNTDEDSPGYGTVAFGSITINQGNTSATAFTFGGLPMGTYTVEELDHMRYDLVSMTNGGNVQLTKDSEATKNKEVEVVNEKVTDDYFSDSAIAVNQGIWVNNVIHFIKKEDEV